MRKLKRTPSVVAVFAAAGAGFGIWKGTSGAKDDPKPKASESTSAAEDVELTDWAAEALPGVVPMDLGMLSDHATKYEEPEIKQQGTPMPDCEAAAVADPRFKRRATQVYEGEPTVISSGYSFKEPAAEAFEQLRGVWDGDCTSYEIDINGLPFKYEQVLEIEVPGDSAADGWFGACYKGSDDSGTKVAGTCTVLFPVGEHTIAELTTFQHPDDNEVNEVFLGLLATEMLMGQ